MVRVDQSGWVPLRPDENFSAQLLAASRAQRGLDCADAEVAAADVRAACLAAGEADQFGLRLAGARIVGPLDLRASTIPVAVHFQDCDFTDPVNVEGARLQELAIFAERPKSHPDKLPGLIALGVQVAHNLVLSGMVISGDHHAGGSANRPASIWLTGAEIGGNLLVVGTWILPTNGRAIHADRIRIAGNIRLERVQATGEVRLPAMHLAGSLGLIGTELMPLDGRALDINEANIGNSLFLLNMPRARGRCRIRGRIEMSHSIIQGQLLIRNADLTAPPTGQGGQFYTIEPTGSRIFLLAPRLTVRGALVMEGDTVVRGGLLMPGAQLDGGVRLAGAVWNADDVALDLKQSILGGDLHASALSIEGTVRLDNARISGPLTMEHTTVAKPLDRRCISAVNLKVAGDVQCRGLSVLSGSFDLRGASVTGVVNLEDAFLTNPGGSTVSLYMARATGNVRLCGRFHSIGLVDLNRAVVDGRLRADGATMIWRTLPLVAPTARSAAFQARFADIRGGVDLGWRLVEGSVDFTGTTTSYLGDDPVDDWPADSYVGGFAYERFAGTQSGEAIWNANDRIAWLSRMRSYDPRAWEHLAAVLRSAGDQDGADTVLIAQRRHARSARAVPHQLFDLLQDVTVRYGFRPQRAVYLLIALIAAVTLAVSLPVVQAQMRATDQNALVFMPAGARPRPGETAVPGRCGDGKVRCLNPFFYAVDTVVPLIDLHQRSTWYPISEQRGWLLEWLLNLCTILGWVASTVFALSFTRLGRAN